jgi:hypothetical protein
VNDRVVRADFATPPDERRRRLAPSRARKAPTPRALARRRMLVPGSEIQRAAQANIAAELARDYVQSRVPDALARFKIDTSGLDQMIRARLPAPRQPVA